MNSGKKNALLFIGALLFMAVIVFNNRHKYNEFLEEFDYSKAKSTGLPVLLQVGFENCSYCKAMKPILKDLKENYSDKFSVAYIDINYDQHAMSKYRANVFPTMIFLDKDGNELYRQIGYMEKSDILKKWQDLSN